MTLYQTHYGLSDPTILHDQDRVLQVLPGEGAHELDSRDKFDEYYGLRIAAAYAEKSEGPELRAIQEDVRQWLVTNYADIDNPGSVEDYSTYDVDVVQGKIGALVDYLRLMHPNVSEVELDATDAFIDSAFAMYEDRERCDALHDRDGSFAFIVPARMSRIEPQYGREVEPVIPALRYVPNELRAWIMRGCPPFVIDVYKPGPDGKRGYLIYAPVTGDMQADLKAQGNGTFMHTAQAVVNDAVSLAHDRLGAEVVGLGATLPMVTYFGKTVRQKFGDEVIVTTGHGGTVELICATIDANTGEIPESVGILGLGSIGASAAAIAAERYDGRITIFDPDASKTRKLTEAYPGRFNEADGVAQVIDESQVVISAIVTASGKPLDLNSLGVGDMSGKLVVDDSQPAGMVPSQVRDRGGRYLWVIGRDDQGMVRRIGYDYGMMLDGSSDLFGCEAEAAVLAAYWHDLQEQRGYTREEAKVIVGRVAITGPVTAESAGRIGKLFNYYDITAARPQAFGRPA